MKKFLAIALLMIYGFSSSGMTISLHYCCGKLKKVEWSPVKEEKCAMGHKKMGKKPCCETKEINAKQQADQEHFLAAVKHFKQVSEASKPLTIVHILQPVNRQVSPVAFAPPPYDTSPLFLLNRVFRI